MMSVQTATDVFVSYAHEDNQPLVEGVDGWVTTFQLALTRKLSQVLGRRPNIFWDRKRLRGNDDFSTKLDSQVSEATALVVIVTPTYCGSKWCRRELDGFLQGRGGTAAAGEEHGGSIFKVMLFPVEEERQDPRLGSMLGYPFFAVSTDGSPLVEYAHDGTAAGKQGYFQRLSDLAQDLAKRLSQVASTPGPALPPAATASLTTPTSGDFAAQVYLATTSYDSLDTHDQLRRELLSLGYNVRPDGELPLVAERCRAKASEQLRGCDLAVHLIGTNYGVVPEGSPLSVVEIQEEESRKIESLRRIIWMPRGLVSVDERQSGLLERLRSQPTCAKSELMESSLEALKTLISERVEAAVWAKKSQRTSAKAGGIETNRSVYVIGAKEDEESLEGVADLLDAEGYAVNVPLFDGNEEEVRHDHTELLSECDGALIYFRFGSEAWLRRTVRDLAKSIVGRSEGKPLVAQAVYLEEVDVPRSLRRCHIPVLGGTDTLCQTALAPFIAQLEGQ